MKRYGNLTGNSGILIYETGPDSILIGFGDGSIYVYTYASAGEADVETMKALAHAGRGLNGFITRVIKSRYAQRMKRSA